MSKFLPLAVLALPLSAAPAVAQCAAGWDLAADWSELTNPNSAWSYNAGAVPIGAHHPNWANTGNSAWAAAPGGFGHVPAWLRVTHAGQPNLGPDAVPGVVAMHGNDPASGTDVDLANVTWTAPIAGSFSLHGDLWHTDAHQRATDWRLTLNGAQLDSGTLTHGDAFGPNAPRSFDFPIVVVAGDVVKLEFERADPFGTFACVRLSITRHGLFMASPVPGVAGQAATFRMRGASPNGRVMVGYSSALGSFNLPGCGGVQGCLQAPQLARALNADASGAASFTATIPPQLSGRTFMLQAGEPGACHVSNLVRHTF